MRTCPRGTRAGRYEGVILTVECRRFEEGDREQVVALWTACDLTRPWNDPHRDVDRKVAHDPHGFLVLDDDGEIVGSVMVGYDGHRGWVNYLATAPSRRRHGLGRWLVAEAERRLDGLGCPKVNLQIRASNAGVVDFYRRLGYDLDDAVSMGKRLESDEVRPPGPDA